MNQMHKDWIPIDQMHEHVHGLYLCLIESKSGERYCVQERYFTYTKENEASFQSKSDAKDVIAFLVPRFYSLREEDKLIVSFERDNAKLQERLTGLDNVLRQVEGILSYERGHSLVSNRDQAIDLIKQFRTLQGEVR